LTYLNVRICHSQRTLSTQLYLEMITQIDQVVQSFDCVLTTSEENTPFCSQPPPLSTL
jgi:hypothetical protein